MIPRNIEVRYPELGPALEVFYDVGYTRCMQDMLAYVRTLLLRDRHAVHSHNMSIQSTFQFLTRDVLRGIQAEDYSPVKTPTAHNGVESLALVIVHTILKHFLRR